jgi:alpha-1,2-mannosyltransferase
MRVWCPWLLLLQVLEMDQRDRLKIAAAAQRRAATMFSTEHFHRAFLKAVAPVLPKQS